MLNYIWGIMILLAVVVSLFTGNIAQVTNAAISGGKEAVSLAITMAGVVATWTGIMKIAEKGGMIKILSIKMRPLLKFLFPELPENHRATQYIATNFVANFLGLGWAATPAGLSAMKELNKLNRDKTTATKTMCMFMIINMSSIQLVPVTMIAYRMEYGSSNPAEILGAGILATILSTVAGIISAKMFERKY